MWGMGAGQVDRHMHVHASTCVQPRCLEQQGCCL
eukprot:CAMPEP_0194771342 /NCGR_PEP_ID=MMETSP0323_2-20130528/48958_1 /TAXON_ID=2866 ORGANISM="Crypthecodinium cohnii, Strain Seligo" /NCGR_SAMPLE_ID=MMETSP0323_2 /ASSEMBLY_ACC=CAM_ASM_000346 /LENGTH=33 /DNA_ID= /DNA_START= /DNA_END= /DNA_ORIENTATION=